MSPNITLWWRLLSCPQMLQTHSVTASLSFVNIFLLSQWYNFSWLSFITSLVTVYWQLTVRYKKELQALECSHQNRNLEAIQGGLKGLSPRLQTARPEEGSEKKGPARSFPRVRDGTLVFLKCKLITKRGGDDNNIQNSKKPLEILEGSLLIPGYISY